MLLRGKEIRERLFSRDGEAKDWLVISPILELGEQLQDGSSSIDLRLASVFVVPNRVQLEKLDPADESYHVSKARYMDEVIIPIGEKFVLHPRQFALGQTLEWIHLPRDLGGYLVGRSTWGRDGLIIATAAGVHPGWSGPLTLELSNVGEVPILLYPGLTYAQLFLHALAKTGVVESGDMSDFTGTPKPVSGKPKLKDLRIIQSWPESKT